MNLHTENPSVNHNLNRQSSQALTVDAIHRVLESRCMRWTREYGAACDEATFEIHHPDDGVCRIMMLRPGVWSVSTEMTGADIVVLTRAELLGVLNVWDMIEAFEVPLSITAALALCQALGLRVIELTFLVMGYPTRPRTLPELTTALVETVGEVVS